jgi:hypothetical protein
MFGITATNRAFAFVLLALSFAKVFSRSSIYFSLFFVISKGRLSEDLIFLSLFEP